MNIELNVGDRVIADNITAEFEVVGLRTVESFEPMPGAELRRVMPNGQLESGQPVWLPLDGIKKLGSLANLI